MDDATESHMQVESRGQWNVARRRAFFQRLYSSLGLSKAPITLLSFEEVQEKLRLTQNAYRGLQDIPLDQIVGSVGRYNDFTRTFLPLVEEDSWRWRRVAELQSEHGLPPVELYKVGDAYFVKDGNHRVSVARQFNARQIEAYVWEYENPVGGLPPKAGIDDLIVKAEYRAFLDQTRLNFSRPEQNIILTEPGMYPALELEIELYRQNLQQIDGEERTIAEAASAWYDMVYTLAVDLIQESGVLNLFPGRTEADLYLWVSRHRKELSERYGEHVSLRDAVAQIAEAQQAKPSPMGRMMNSVVQSITGLVHSLTPSASDALRDETQELDVLPDENQPLGKLLAQIRSQNPSMAYRGERGEEWWQWRQALRTKVGELLGVSYQPHGQVKSEVIHTDLISGVERLDLRLTAADGLKLPAYLMYPADMTEPAPALLIYPGHGTIRDTAGVDESLHMANALALAQTGYVTLTVEERGFGTLGEINHNVLDNVARLIGKTWLGMAIDDGRLALDYLQSLPNVKPSSLGVTGLGLGGGLAIYTAALDERVIAVINQNYLTSSIDRNAMMDACDFIPYLRHYASLGDVARLVVPRPMLFVYPKDRPTTALARSFFDQMRPSYEVFRCPDRTRFFEHDGGGIYNNTIAQFWFDRWLMEEEDPSCLLIAPTEE